MRIKHLIFAVTLAAAPSVTFAHDVAKGAHGGQVVDDKGHHVELTTEGNDLVVYLTDEKDQPIDSSRVSGRIMIAGRNAPAALVPGVPNVLAGKLDVPLVTGSKIVVKAKLADGHDIQARFVIK